MSDNPEWHAIRGQVAQVEGDRWMHWLGQPDMRMPGDDHPGARYTQPQIRVWEGPEPCQGAVIAEARLNEHQPGLIVEAWSRDREANQIMVEEIKVWAAHKGVDF